MEKIQTGNGNRISYGCDDIIIFIVFIRSPAKMWKSQTRSRSSHFMELKMRGMMIEIEMPHSIQCPRPGETKSKRHFLINN